MRWDNVITPKGAGGLGLGNMELKNRALLAKWWWRFEEERGALWRIVIATKYGEDVWGWVPSRVPRHRVPGLWGNLMRVGDSSTLRGELFSRGVGFKVGEASRSRFWFDDCVEGGPLVGVFPTLFRVVINKHSPIKLNYKGEGILCVG